MVQTATVSRTKAETALTDLLQGNKRYQQGNLQRCVFNKDRFEQLKTGQAPPAVVLSCSDSRVPPEMVLDQGLGDVFVIRVAGNVLDENVLGSMLFSLQHLGSRLVIVLGHSKCGACTAAQGAYIAAQSAPGQTKATDPISNLLSPIVDCCGHLAKSAGAGASPEDLKKILPVPAVVAENTIQVATVTLKALEKNLGNSDILGEVLVVSAVYDLDDGSVKVLHQQHA